MTPPDARRLRRSRFDRPRRAATTSPTAGRGTEVRLDGHPGLPSPSNANGVASPRAPSSRAHLGHDTQGGLVQRSTSQRGGAGLMCIALVLTTALIGACAKDTPSD